MLGGWGWSYKTRVSFASFEGVSSVDEAFCWQKLAIKHVGRTTAGICSLTERKDGIPPAKNKLYFLLRLKGWGFYSNADKAFSWNLPIKKAGRITTVYQVSSYQWRDGRLFADKTKPPIFLEKNVHFVFALRGFQFDKAFFLSRS